MAYDGLMFYNEVELFNVSRTATLAETLGIDAVWVSPSSVEWIRQALGNPNYSSVATAPWFDSAVIESFEFAGVLPLSVAGLSDSSLTSTPVEFITDGGVPGRARHATQDLVFSAAIVASTERGAAYGLRWLNKVLAATGNLSHHAGFPLAYLDSERGEGLRRHNVRVTRGVSVTRKRTTDCSSVWLVTFTLNSANPFAYGTLTSRITAMGPKTVGAGGITGPGVLSSGYHQYDVTNPPTPNYNPVLDPEFPALLAPPSTPDPLPTNWPFPVGLTLNRYWARIGVMEPSAMPVVPVFTIQSDTAFRGARLSIWDFTDNLSRFERHNFLFSASFGYVPAGSTVTVDGIKKQVYTSNKRRAESLVFNTVGGPLDWTTIRPSTANGQLLVALDVVGAGVNAQCSLSLAQKHG